MTEFDRILIEKALNMRRYNFHDIDVLISIADTQEAQSILSDIQFEHRQAVLETI